MAGSGCKAGLLLLFSTFVAVASAGAVGPRRMLRTTLPDPCTVLPCTLIVAGTTLSEAIPGPVPNTFIVARVQGYGYSTTCSDTTLSKQIEVGAAGLSFDLFLSGHRYHYGHVVAHCADLYAEAAQGGKFATLTPCVNPDPVATYVTDTLLSASEAKQLGLPVSSDVVLLLFEVICGDAPVPDTPP